MNLSKAKSLRANQTEAEKRLWSLLRDNQFQGLKFRGQVSMGKYVADFICHKQNLVIEVDGGQHSVTDKYDKQRTQWFESQGYTVLRFWNNEVLENTEGVLIAIANFLNDPLT
ncbi:MAG: endonuclease domain-containing protein [Proteobacteria bacterium]|nr:endonuclease domain-containing protein [Pseudomonadota bacterium]